MTYQKLSVSAKRAVDRIRVREAPLVCPRCTASVMPSDLADHGLRCAGELPPSVHPASRWVNRTAALQYTTARVLDRWVGRGLVRRRDDRYLERDLAIACAWSRALEAV